MAKQRPMAERRTSFGSGGNLAGLETRGIEANAKVQPPPCVGGRFTKDDFDV